MKEPGWIPYRWFWVLGGVLIVMAAVLAFQGLLLVSVTSVIAGAMIVVLGYVERHRGAPPI